MPFRRSEPRRYRAQTAPMGIPQYRRQPRSQSSSQTSSDAYDHLGDLSPSEPSVPLLPAHIPGTQLTGTDEEPSSDKEPTIVDLALRNHSMDQDTESNRSNTHSQREETSQPDKLQLLHVDKWEEGEAYDELVPSCIHYSIEWKVTFNNKLISKDTEQNLVLAPIFYWPLFLQPKLEKLLCKKLPSNKRVRPDDTNVVISVTDRSERDLTKRFDETDIEWPVIEKQLVAWGELFRAGKKLRLDISFNYIETGQLQTSSGKRGDKRNAEEATIGEPSVWRDVYALMHCKGRSCHLGPHCWEDPVGKKHYKLKTHQLKALIRHVEHGGHLRTQDDVPEGIREQIYAEEQQRLERHQRAAPVTSSNIPPINITNVLPGPSSQSLMPTLAMANPQSIPSRSAETIIELLSIPGLRDIALKEYTVWQQSQVSDDILKAEYMNAYKKAMEAGLDLE
ncbi:hypothetical protein EG329_008014 [Mollisiaceae sp. DMI_Dod_QoI]|nr:hypothetical protein EG329_008014 [Helotiales sp. DMI_Dod_QoI]